MAITPLKLPQPSHPLPAHMSLAVCNTRAKKRGLFWEETGSYRAQGVLPGQILQHSIWASATPPPAAGNSGAKHHLLTVISVISAFSLNISTMKVQARPRQEYLRHHKAMFEPRLCLTNNDYHQLTAQVRS